MSRLPYSGYLLGPATTGPGGVLHQRLGAAVCRCISLWPERPTGRSCIFAMTDRAGMLKEQAQLLRDLAEAPDQHPEVRERIHKLAQECEELAQVLERSVKNDG